jgi:hypothetical protein
MRRERRASGVAGRDKGSRTLSHHPERCPLAQENASFDQPIRELLFGEGNRGVYRIIFVLIDKSVYVLPVRHGSMLPLDAEQLK